jgi:hypothetical protein
MSEREPNNNQEPSFEEAYSSLQEATKHVKSGYWSKVNILVEERDPKTENTEVSFPPLPSVSSEIALRAVETLKKELGYDQGHEWHHEGTTFYIPTDKWEIIFSREEIYQVTEGKERELIGVVWSLENLKPMNLGQQFFYKGREIFGRFREAVRP